MKRKFNLTTRFGVMFLILVLLVVFATPQAWAKNVILTVELNEWYSCPFVLTWDGSAYQRDNDIYSVGRNAEREYTDYLFLNNAVVPKDGVYSFEIREIPTEESWTDMLKLITIDHPAGVSVGVDSSGNVHSYANPSPPHSAYDGNGIDVLSLITARDDKGVGMYHNDVVVLDFSSVDITEGAKLVIDMDGFEGEPSGQPTGQVPAIQIQTLESGSWVTRHSFFPKEFWAEGVFDLKPYLGESKTVRLLSLSCDQGKYQLIDYVGLDNTADVLSYSVLEPATAVLNGSTDVLGDISNSDNVYAYTKGSDTIVVTFPFNPPAAGEERSFAFVSEGYYKPGSGSTYYVDTWNGSSWVQRLTLYNNSGWGPFPDATVSADLSAYLPDPDGEYKIKLRNSMDPGMVPHAEVDWVSMSIDFINYNLTYAKELDTTDILSLVKASDDVKWDALNKWAVFKFSRVVLTVELNEWYSCPFVLTWDGSAYQLDNDIYSVGRNAEREYIDYLFLNKTVVPKDGVYSFEIRELPSEESWTDMLKLITIDHPAGVSVGVDSSGNVHSYANPSPPDSADGNGIDVLSLISSRDDKGVDMYHNDVVVLDFSSVDITEGAKLVIDIDGFEGKPSGNPTGQVPAIQIQTLESGSWVTRHSFFPKELWAEGVFDLQPYLGESKTVRLLSLSCDQGKYHRIDYVGLDNTEDTLSYSVLNPATAVLNGSTDVLSEISNSDNVYTYTKGSDTIVVTFPFNPPAAGEERSFAFVSEGYYKPGSGSTYYVDTWDGSSWVQRITLYNNSGWGPFPDATVSADLSAYLPDLDGEYKIKLRNSMDPGMVPHAEVDWVSMSINGANYNLTYAKELDTTDILSLVKASDDVKWDALNKWAVFKFSRVLLTVELNEWYSCPFVLTWDGSAYQRDNDIYSVGRNAEREYTDYLFLNNAVVPKDGVYSFEIREIPTEESWTDMLKLITIDHPAGVSVGVDSSGNVHSYANPSPPDSADGNGIDVLSLITARDDKGVGMYHNDVVVLDFSSVDITEGAKLVIDVDGFEGEPAGKPTGKVPAIQIQTLESGSWVTRHSFFPKEFWAEGVFDLKPYLGESKAVRLLSLSCDQGKYQLIDYVGLDNTADTLSYSVLNPATAVLNGSTDVLGDISNSDNVYAYTKGSDTIVVTFPFNPPAAGEERSFAFVSEGYYKPGSGSTYYVDTWNGSSWVQRLVLYDPLNSSPSPDVVVSADLSAYLPDPDGEYKIHIRNSMIDMQPHAEVDWVSMSIDFVNYKLAYAKEFDTTDILSLVKASDDVKWDALNKWAVFKFKPYLVQFEDFAKFSKQWLRNDCTWPNKWCDGADLNQTGIVDEFDLSLFVDEWLCPRPEDWPLQ